MDGQSTPRPRGIRAIEESAIGGWAWAVLLLGWILARNLLEGVLERPHQLGFDWRPDLSFAMVFLHFPLFYLALFLGITLWLHGLTRKPIAAVARVVTLGYAVLLVVPIVDALVSRGRGYDLKYLLGVGSVLWRFWDPSVVPGEVSPGQRVEIVLAVLLSGAYVWITRRARVTSARPRERGWIAAGPALLGATGSFLLIAFLGAWPSLFARLTASGSSGWEASYTSTYRLGGLIADESRRHAIVMAIPFTLGLIGFAWRLNPTRFRAFLQSVSWVRLIHYSGLVVAGAGLGWLTYREFLGAFGNGTDWAALIVLWAAMAVAFLAALLWNHRHDCEADRINDPGRPRAAGALTDAGAHSLSIVSAMLALFLALCVGYAPFLLMTAVLLLAWLYSAPPVRTKRWPGLSTLTLGLLSLLSLACGYSLFAQEMTLAVLPWRFAAYLLIGVTLGFTAKDLKDAAGDRATGVTTLATLLPERAARALTAALVAIGYLLGPVFLRLGAVFTAVAILFAGVSAWVTLRRRRPDGVLLAGLLIFAALCLALLAQRPEVLRERVPAPLREWHAQLRAAEEEVRIARVFENDPASAERLGVTLHREKAAAALDRLLALVPAAGAAEPGEERVRWARAQTASWPVARADLDALMRLCPMRAEYWDAALAGAGRAGDTGAARVVCDAAIDRGIRPGDFLRNRAALAIGAGETGRATQRDLAGAFLFGPREPLCWVLLGDLALRGGDPAGAAEAYARATERDPDLAEAWSGLGEVRRAGGDLAGALEAFARARRLAPRDPWVLNNQGVVLRDLGRTEEALARFEQAHALAPDLFEPLFNLGLTSERMQRVDVSRRWFEAARRLRPDFPPVEDALRRVGTPPTTTGEGEGRGDD